MPTPATPSTVAPRRIWCRRPWATPALPLLAATRTPGQTIVPRGIWPARACLQTPQRHHVTETLTGQQNSPAVGGKQDDHSHNRSGATLILRVLRLALHAGPHGALPGGKGV